MRERNIKASYLAEKIGVSAATLNRKIQGKIRFLERDIKIILNEFDDMSYENLFKTKDISIVIVNGKKFTVSTSTASEVIEILKKEVS
jgi:transcriptional regulator with XRE-family HTH domain